MTPAAMGLIQEIFELQEDYIDLTDGISEQRLEPPASKERSPGWRPRWATLFRPATGRSFPFTTVGRNGPEARGCSPSPSSRRGRTWRRFAS